MSDLIITPSSGKIDFIYQSGPVGQEGQTSRLESIIIDPIDGLVFSGKISASSVNSPLNITATSSNINYPFIFASSGETGAKSLLMDSAGGTYNPSTNLATVNISGTSSWATNAVTNANLTGDVTSVGNATTIANSVVTNAKLANSSVTIGSTAISLGADGAQTTIVGLVSVTSTTFVGALTGTATTASYANALNAANSYTVAGITGNLTGTATTASYANNLNAANQYTVGGITGSHFGTSSWATNATNALQLGGTAAASYVTLTGAQNLSDKTITGTFTGNLTGTATTASYANNLNAANQYTVGGITGSLFGTSSWASNAVTSLACTGNAATVTNGLYTNSTLTAGNLSGTIPSAVLGNSTVYIGSTAVPLNRANTAIVLTGITSIDGNAATATTASYANALNPANNYTVNSLTEGGYLAYPLREYVINFSALSATNFYPVAIDTPPGTDATWHNQFSVDMVNQSGDAAYNVHSMYGEVRGQGWTDQNQFYRVFHTFYDSAERSILGIWRGTQTFYGVVVYLRGGKNYYVRTTSRSAVGYSAAQTLGSAVFAIKNAAGADVSGTSANIGEMLNLINNPSGFYHSDNAYIGTDKVLNLATTSAPNLSIGGTAATATNSTQLNGQAASYYTDITARLGYTPVDKAGDTVTGNLIINGNFSVNGSFTAFSASNVYISSSQLYIEDNILTLNAFSPYLRYAGVEMYDSGSGTLSSLLWDGEADYFFLSGSSVNGKIITGPDSQANLSANFVPKATAGYKLGNSVIYDDGTNIGIGLTTPDLRLHIEAANAYPATSGTTPTGFLTLRAKTAGGTHGMYMGVANASPYGSWIQCSDSTNLAANYPLLLNPNGGNVGIGTTSPGTLLNVHGATPFVRINTTATADHGIKISYNNSDTHGLHLLYNANSALSYIDNTYPVLSTFVYGDIYFRQNVAGTMTTRMTIKGDGGNVGIGTTTPSGKLHVNSTTAGATLLRTDGTNGTLFSVVDDLSDSLMSVNNSAGLPVLEVFADDRIVMGQYGQNDFVLVNNKVGIGTNNPANKLYVSGSVSIGSGTYNTSAPTNGLIVEGKVGVGTNSVDSWAQLKVIGTSALGGIVYVTDKIQALSAFPGSATNLQLNTDGGNVGIGTTLPFAKLHVQGNISGSSFTSSISNAVGFLGTSSWATNAVTALNGGVTSVSGTENQVIVSGNTGAVTFSLPQNIHTTATPTFTSVSATTFTGNLTGTATTASYANALNAANSYTVVGITGNLTGTATTASYANNLNAANKYTVVGITGSLFGTSSWATNAVTATILQNARTIGGVSFDGSANINLPGVNAAGNQDTSGTAATATNATQLGGFAAASYVTLADTQSLSNKTLTSPILVTPALGTPSSGNLTSCTFPTLNQNTTGTAATASYANALNPANSYTVTGITGNLTGTSSWATNAVTALNVGNGTITIAGGTGVGVGSSNTFTTNQSGATTVTITNTGVTSNVAGTGISVSGATGAVTITNSGVTSAVAGTGVGVSAATGAVTFSIGQAVGTTATPTFASVSATTFTGTATTASYANALNAANSYTVTNLTASGVGKFFGNIAIITDASAGDYSLIAHKYDGVTKAFSGYNGGMAIYGGETGIPTRIQAGGQYALTALTNGNIGIGTTSPTAKLVVMGDDVYNYTKSSVPTAIIAGDDVEFLIGSTDNFAGEEITLRLGTVHSSYYTYGAYVKAIQGSGVDYYKLAFGTSNGAVATTKMTIANDGNVGIGSTVASASLHINSTTAGATLLRTDGTNGTLFSVVDDLSDSLMSVNNSAGLPVLEVFADDRIVAGQYGQNDFVVVNNKVGIGTNNPLAKLHVTGSSSVPAAVLMGNVGIGTTSFVYSNANRGLLEIYGSSDALISLRNDTANSYLQKSGNDFYFNNGGAGFISITTNGSERMYIKSDGNVGIGTSVPLQKLHVLGNISTISQVSSGEETNRLQFYNIGAATYDIASIRAFVGAGQTNRGELGFYVNNGAGQQLAMYIDRSQNVGIGIAVPTTPLHVVGVISGSSFTGAGTGLTGTAANLSVGGSAATATSASFATTAATAANGGVTSIAAGTSITVSTTTGAVTVNNAAPNETHTGEVTGATVLTIADSAVITARIANAAVTTIKIADANVTTAKLATDAVTDVKITNGTITNLKLANSAVTVGTTSISLGAAETTIGGLVSVTSNLFVGPLTGNVTGTADTANALTTNNSYTVGNLTVNTMAQLTGVKETYVGVTPASNVVTIDLNAGTVFRLTYNSVINSFTISNLTAAKVNSFTLISIPAAGAGGINFTFNPGPFSLVWAGNVIPTATTTVGKFDVFSFIYDGTRWYGFVGGLNY